MDPEVVQLFIPIIGVIAVFTFVSVVVVAKTRARLEDRKALYETARLAIEKGQPLPPELVKSLTTRQDPYRRFGSPSYDLRLGLLVLAAGIGVGVIGAILTYRDPDKVVVLGAAALICLVGGAFILMSRLNPDKDEPSKD